jgi:hypothetical protein
MVRRRIQKISLKAIRIVISLPNSSLPQKLYIVTAARLVHFKIPENVSSDVNDNEQATLTLPMGTSMMRNKRLTLHTVNSVTPQGVCLATLTIRLYDGSKKIGNFPEF